MKYLWSFIPVPIAALLVSCGGASDTGSPPIEASSSSSAVAVDDNEELSSRVNEILRHNYVDDRNGVYYYATEISDADRSNGIAAPDVVAVKYVECRVKSDFCLAVVDSRGLPQYSIACSPPCKVVRIGDGRISLFDPKSIAGAALEDAMTGKLQKTALYPEMREEVVLPGPSASPNAPDSGVRTDSSSDAATDDEPEAISSDS